jgi:hypothetical protein
VTVKSQQTTPKPIFGTGCSSNQPILVPSNKDLLLHVTSWGFLEWEQTIGTGKAVRISPGSRMTLDVELQPSNPLTERVPDADPKKYQGVQDAKDWRNPYVRAAHEKRGWAANRPASDQVNSLTSSLLPPSSAEPPSSDREASESRQH